MSQQSELADYARKKLETADLPAAHLVGMIRTRWKEVASPSGVHFFVSESGWCLLARGDIDIGDIHESCFNPWLLEPEDAHEKFETELCELQDYLEDESRFVFRKKTNEPNQ